MNPEPTLFFVCLHILLHVCVYVCEAIFQTYRSGHRLIKRIHCAHHPALSSPLPFNHKAVSLSIMFICSLCLFFPPWSVLPNDSLYLLFSGLVGLFYWLFISYFTNSVFSISFLLLSLSLLFRSFSYF